MMMSNLIAIGLGGALGALSRYGVSVWMGHAFGRGFPWGTLSVNVLGSLLMGFLVVWFSTKMELNEALKNGVLVGFLGAFTTYSAFALDKMNFMQAEQLLKLCAYFGLTTVGALCAVVLGAWLAKQWT